MQLTSVVLHLFLFGFVLYTVKSQELIVTEAGDHDPEVVSDPADNEDSALAKLSNTTTYEDFFALLQKDGRPVRLEDYITISPNESADGKHHITNAVGRMAEPDECSARDTTVRLPLDFSDPRFVYFPRCTRVKRCGGCCSSSNLECLPAYIERESLQVLKAEVPFPGASHLEPVGFNTVIVEKHVTCHVKCNLNAEKCGPKKEFLSGVCDCKCRSYQRCQPPQMWNTQECACICPEIKVCCPRGDNCGLKFNNAICNCDLSDARAISHTNITQEDIDLYFGNRTSSNESSQDNASHDDSNPSEPNVNTQTPATTPSTTPTTTTTTTTTTTQPPEETNPDPCATINCPPGFSKVVNADDQCVCRPPMRYTPNRFRSRQGRR